MGKTGGGRGTNQHAVKGRSVARARAGNPDTSRVRSDAARAARRDAVFSELVLGGIPAGAAQKLAGCGATTVEAKEIVELRVPVDEYTAARRSGITHTETLVVYLSGRSAFPGYIRARRAGETHDDACELAGIPTAAAVDCHETLTAWKEHQIPPVEYAACRKAGATHDEIVDARRSGFPLSTYTASRRAGATHDETLEARQVGCSLLWYAQARAAKISHTETLEAHRAGCDLGGYIARRRRGESHSDALMCALPPTGPDPFSPAS